MNITVTIMAHPKRRKQANALLAQLANYPFKQRYITWDQKNDEWDTGARSLQGGIGGGDWHLVLQDDAILTPNFYDNLVGAIEAVPTKVLISLYVGTAKPMPERVQEAVDKAEYASWLKHNMLFWGVGIVMPTSHIEPLLDFVSDPMFHETLYDTRIGMFYERNRLPVYYTMPSLVDHDDDLDSIVGTNAKAPRVAHRLARGIIKWNDQVIDL